MKKAFESGALTLDCYDGYLRDLYAEFGFRETARMKFDPEYAHEDWNFGKYGRPDVVFMHYAPREPLEFTDDYIGPGEWEHTKQESRREANTEARSPPEGSGVRGGEHGTDTGSGEESGRPVEVQGDDEEPDALETVPQPEEDIDRFNDDELAQDLIEDTNEFQTNPCEVEAVCSGPWLVTGGIIDWRPFTGDPGCFLLSPS